MKIGRIGVARYLRKTLVEQLKPCFLLLDGEFHVCRIDGDAAHYGYAGLELGTDCREAMPFLFGLGAGEAIHLPLVETASRAAADVLLSPMDGSQGLLFTDVGRERAARQMIQQQANELSLLHKGQQRLVEELRAARDDLSEKHLQAQEAGRVKSRFIAGLSHEFRTPLSGIIGHADLLRDPRCDPKSAAESLMLIEANAKHLLSLVENVLDQASLEVGQLALHPVPCRLTDFSREMQLMFAPAAAHKGLKFDLTQRGMPPELVELDVTRLRQITMNLVNNAIKYTEAGRVTLTVAWAEDRLRVGVIDTGPGITPAGRERIFMAFHREPDATGKQGVGLGLTISHQLVALMGGEMHSDDRPGGGSIFRFSVPAPMIAESTSGLSEDGGGRRILLVDDSCDIRVLYGRILEKAGFRVDTASDEPEAWHLFESRRPQLVIADLYLKEWDGSGLVRRLRDRGYSGGVVAWSASSLREDKLRAMGAGADAYLVKPVEPKVLRATVGDLMRRRESS